MCDYSLHAIKNRLAVDDEELVVHRFHTGSKGLASKSDFEAIMPRGLKRLIGFLGLELNVPLKNLPAVCVPPGARLILSGLSRDIQNKYGVGERAEVTFTQTTSEPFQYRDAVRFTQGKEVLLQRLNEGARVTVLALAPAEIEEEQQDVMAPAHVRSFA